MYDSIKENVQNCLRFKEKSPCMISKSSGKLVKEYGLTLCNHPHNCRQETENIFQLHTEPTAVSPLPEHPETAQSFF
jgi:hypothetical protein